MYYFDSLESILKNLLGRHFKINFTNIDFTLKRIIIKIFIFKCLNKITISYPKVNYPKKCLKKNIILYKRVLILNNYQ